MKFYYSFLLFSFFLGLGTWDLGLGIWNFTHAQTNPCTPNTPVYYVNLAGNPSGTWVSSPPIVRDGSCCGSLWPDRCIVFLITLDTATIAVNFTVASGAIPPGAMFYQIDCGPPTQVGQPICLQGPGPYALTFCKPGANLNTYAITAIAEPSGPPNDTVGIGCNTSLSVSGLNPSSVTWTSIFPGSQGAFNNYLSCTAGCTTTVVTPQPGAPTFVDYKVCGQSLAPSCLPDPNFCDTVRVFFNPALNANVTPDPAIYCANAGGITLTGNVSGGDGTYFYQWTNQAGNIVGNSVTYSATSQGTYIFQVYDGQYPGCPARYDTVVVTQQTEPTVSAGPDKIICSGGSIALSGTMSGATGVQWSGGNGFFNPNNTSLNITYTPSSTEIAAGVTTLTLSSTGNGACPSATDQITIFIKPVLTATIAGSSIVCFGSSTQLTANVTGGTAPYAFVWNTGSTSQSIIASPGNYSVTVTDMSSGTCTSVATFSVLQDPQVSVSVSPNSSINCSVTTAISATPSGGTGSFSYLWNTGQTSQTVIVYPGIYTVTVTDGVGCSASGTVNVVGINSTLSASIQQPSNLCFGGNKNITIVASGGFGGYNYQWSTGQTLQTINVTAGTYCCTATDGGGCITTACVTVNQNSPLSVSITNPSPVCNGAVDTIWAVPNGGQSPYTYLWSTGQTSQGIIQGAGTYSVTITDANQNGGCTANSTAIVFNEPNFTISINSNNVNCFGGSNGNATVSASGGVPGYTYLWSPSGGNTTTANNLSAGSYTIAVTDNIGCIQTGTVNITEPLVLFASISVTSNVNCSGGSNGVATVSVSGGTTPYSFQWSPYGGTGATATGLIAGTYTVSISDAKGCTNTASATVTQPNVLNATISATNVSCNSGNNGTATVSPSGGTSPYIYNWSNGGNTATISNLSLGNYTVTVTDNRNCTVIKSVSIAQPSALTAGISSGSNVSCNGAGNGSATASASGGTSPFNFNWSTGINAQTVNNLTPGNYTVTVSDANSCTSTANVNITQPTILLASASPDQSIACNNTITLSSNPNGGTTAYSYQWSNGAISQNILSNTPGIYIVTVSDANSCTAVDSVVVSSNNSTLNASINAPIYVCNSSTNNSATVVVSGGNPGYTYLWSNGSTSATVTGISAGIYCATVTDNSGCKVTSCTNLQNEPAFSVSVTPNATCFGSPQTLTANVTGGINPYSFLWSTGETSQTVVKNAGTYSVTVTDSILCTATITVNITEAPLLQVGFTNVSNVTCKGDANGTATASPTGGTPNYTYQWSSGTANAAAYNLSPGTYSVTVSDAIGCTTTNSVTISEPATILALDSIDGSNINCYGGTNGFGTVNATGGSSPFNYLWWYDNDTVVTNTNLPAGYYSISVADTGGCTAVETIYLSQPNPLAMVAGVISHVTCNGGNTGSATTQVSGGTTPYIYQWSNGASTSSATGLTAGNYTVTVTDVKGCSVQSQTIQIAQPSAISVSFTITNAKCNSFTGSVIANASGGAGNYSYNWSTGATTAILTNIDSGAYNITVTDNSGCIQSLQVTVGTSQPNITIFSSKTNTICTSSTGMAVINNVSGGTAPYSYFWSNGFLNDTISNLPAGSYHVTVTDSTGCVKTDSVSISITEPVINVSVIPSSAICASSTGSVIISNISGGTAPYSFLWSNGSSNDTISNLTSGTYGLTVTDSLGCDTFKTITISATPSTVSFTATIQQVSCYGGNDGLISLNNASGGAPPYTYTWITPSDTGKVIDSLFAGNYTVSVVDTNTCSKDSTFNISQPQPIILSVNARNVSCKGSNDGMISLNVSGGTSPYSFQWNPNVSFTDSASALDTGIYFVTVTDSKGCTKSDSVSINEPSQILNASVSSSIQPSCFGGNNGTATASATGGTTPYSYLWNDSAATSAATATGLTAGNYIVTITDAGGCNEADSVALGQPTEIIAAISGSTNSCVGKSIVITGTQSGGTSPYSYNWGSMGTSASQLVTTTSDTSFIVTVTDNNGCSDSAKIYITVNSIIVPQILSSDTDNTICSGDSVTISASPIGSQYTYIWSPAIGTGPGPFTISPTFTTIYNVSVSDSCGNPVPTSITIVVNPTPTTSPNWLPKSGCAPLSVLFSASPTPGATYLWDFGDGETSIYPDIWHIYTVPDTYIPTVTVTLGDCYTTFFTSTAVVAVYPTPIAEFTANPQPTTMTFPTISFQNISQGGTSYFWDFGDGTTSTDPNANIDHIYKDTGTYTVTLVTSNQIPCTDTFTMEITILPDFQFWIPNAFTPNDKNGKNDVFNGKGICIADYEMYIFDRWGDEIFHTIDINKGWDGKAHRGRKVAQQDVYVYLVLITDCLAEPHRYLGTVTLVR